MEQDIFPDYDMTPPDVEMIFPDYSSINDKVDEGAALKVRIRAVDERSDIKRIYVTLLGGYPYKYPVWGAGWNLNGTVRNIQRISEYTWELTIPEGQIVRHDNPWGPGDWTPIIRIWVTDSSEYFGGNLTELKHKLNVQEDWDNHAPVITEGPTANPAIIFDNETSTLTVDAMDEDGDKLWYYWSVSSANGKVSALTEKEVIYTPPDVDQETNVTIYVSVMDSKHVRTWGNTTITVKPVVEQVYKIESRGGPGGCAKFYRNDETLGAGICYGPGFSVAAVDLNTGQLIELVVPEDFYPIVGDSTIASTIAALFQELQARGYIDHRGIIQNLPAFSDFELSPTYDPKKQATYNILVHVRDYPVRHFKTFPGYRDSGNWHRGVISMLEQIPDGTLTMIGVSDEAGLNRWHSCKFWPYPWVTQLVSEYQSLGSQRIDEYCYRSGWAFAFIKGEGSILGEDLASEGETVNVMLNF